MRVNVDQRGSTEPVEAQCGGNEDGTMVGYGEMADAGWSGNAGNVCTSALR